MNKLHKLAESPNLNFSRTRNTLIKLGDLWDKTGKFPTKEQVWEIWRKEKSGGLLLPTE